MNKLPVIDISQLLISSLSSEEVKLDISRTIRSACETVGCFQIVSHDIKPELFRFINSRSWSFVFFNQTSEEKQQYTVHKLNSANKNIYREYFSSLINDKEGLDLTSSYLNPEHELNLFVNERNLS